MTVAELLDREESTAAEESRTELLVEPDATAVELVHTAIILSASAPPSQNKASVATNGLKSQVAMATKEGHRSSRATTRNGEERQNVLPRPTPSFLRPEVSPRRTFPTLFYSRCTSQPLCHTRTLEHPGRCGLVPHACIHSRPQTNGLNVPMKRMSCEGVAFYPSGLYLVVILRGWQHAATGSRVGANSQAGRRYIQGSQSMHAAQRRYRRQLKRRSY
jgi:hypothetical protein